MIAEKMEQIHGKRSDKGYRRIRDDLEHDFGIDVNDKRVLRICRVKGIKSTIKYSSHGCTRNASCPQHVAENKLNRDFHAQKPNEKWLTDVTEFKWYEGAEVHNGARREDVAALMRLVGLDPAAKKRVSQYSLGMRQRLGIAQALLDAPELLILDEPMSGLDKNGVAEIRALLLDLRAQGKTILLASHFAQDIDALCDTVQEMAQGRIREV